MTEATIAPRVLGAAESWSLYEYHYSDGKVPLPAGFLADKEFVQRYAKLAYGVNPFLLSTLVERSLVPENEDSVPYEAMLLSVSMAGNVINAVPDVTLVLQRDPRRFGTLAALAKIANTSDRPVSFRVVDDAGVYVDTMGAQECIGRSMAHAPPPSNDTRLAKLWRLFLENGTTVPMLDYEHTHAPHEALIIPEATDAEIKQATQDARDVVILPCARCDLPAISAIAGNKYDVVHIQDNKTRDGLTLEVKSYTVDALVKKNTHNTRAIKDAVTVRPIVDAAVGLRTPDNSATGLRVEYSAERPPRRSRNKNKKRAEESKAEEKNTAETKEQKAEPQPAAEVKATPLPQTDETKEQPATEEKASKKKNKKKNKEASVPAAAAAAAEQTQPRTAATGLRTRRCR